MNFNKFINSDYLKSNPLCGIGTYKDILNLATGACTRHIQRVVLTGQENDWRVYTGKASTFAISMARSRDNAGICSHYTPVIATEFDVKTGFYVRNSTLLIISDTRFTDVSDFKTYLAQQYANNTPVVVWYMLATPTTETITVPSGLSGTEVGYLNQSGTPTPTNPIYPTANTVEKWFDINHYVMGTSTDTLTTPADIYANDTTATVGLKGNMVQTGTPTPTTPIQPSECGERTGNLFDKSTVIEGYRYDSYGELFPTPGYSASDYIPVSANESYIRNIYINTNKCVCFYKSDKTFISRQTSGTSITTPAETAYIRTSCATNDINNLMLVQGNTIPSEYIPYGYKIPILNNSQTTNVYLGEMETTRKIRKLVLTGDESCYRYDFQNTKGVAVLNALDVNYSRANGFCSHYPVSITSELNSLWIGVNNKVLYFIGILDVLGISTADGFKTYLQQQYSNGTPVTVWYVLATETTGIVNEPLCKIGGYADEVSGITIPVTAGANTLSVDTTLQPSEVTVNYKGWHPVQSVHERENGAWT